MSFARRIRDTSRCLWLRTPRIPGYSPTLRSRKLGRGDLSLGNAGHSDVKVVLLCKNQSFLGVICPLNVVFVSI